MYGMYRVKLPYCLQGWRVGQEVPLADTLRETHRSTYPLVVCARRIARSSGSEEYDAVDRRCLPEPNTFLFWGGGWSWERFPRSRDRSPLAGRRCHTIIHVTWWMRMSPTLTLRYFMVLFPCLTKVTCWRLTCTVRTRQYKDHCRCFPTPWKKLLTLVVIIFTSLRLCTVPVTMVLRVPCDG
jgi:hypothetical protein